MCVYLQAPAPHRGISKGKKAMPPQILDQTDPPLDVEMEENTYNNDVGNLPDFSAL